MKKVFLKDITNKEQKCFIILLLANLLTLREIQTFIVFMLLSYSHIHIHLDNKNIIFSTLNNMFRWNIFICSNFLYKNYLIKALVSSK